MLGTASVGLESRPLPQAVVDAGVDTKGGSVFLSFGAQVDGATVEVDSGVSALARVAPGVTLPSGFPVLPGKNVTTDAIEQLDDGCIELQVAQGIGTTPGDDPARLAAPSDAARLAYQVRGVRADGSVTPWSASVAAGSVG